LYCIEIIEVFKPTKSEKIMGKDKEKKSLTPQMVKAIEKLKQLQKENGLDGEDIAKKTGIQNSNLSKILNFQRAIPINLLIKLHEKYGWSCDDILFGIKPSVSQKPILKEAIQIILDHIETPEALQKHGDLFLLPILHLNEMGITQDRDSHRLILQGAVYGRRKNVIPISVKSEGKTNIFLFGKREGRERRAK
jgi:transcriptional regulator with XRE-family HTH domain